MVRSLQLLLVVFACASITELRAQATGLNVTLHYLQPLTNSPENKFSSTIVGLGIQHDFARRIGMGLDVNYGASASDPVSALEVVYSAKFFASDNDATSLYIGSLIGVQRLSGTNDFSSAGEEFSHIQIPVGIRAGLRGGLQGYFGELFAQAGYAIGNGELYQNNAGTVSISSSPLYFSVGFSFLGFGWE